MSAYTHNKAYSFINCHQNDKFEAFSRLSNLLIAAKTKYQFLSSQDFGQFHKCGSCSLKHTVSSDFFGII